LFLDTLDNEWLGQGYQERISSIETALEQLETSSNQSNQIATENPTFIITQTVNSDRSVRLAHEEYEQVLQSIQMLVK
jgi:hypothetical protein